MRFKRNAYYLSLESKNSRAYYLSFVLQPETVRILTNLQVLEELSDMICRKEGAKDCMSVICTDWLIPS